MQKRLLLTSSILSLISLSIGISSCDDDDPPSRPKLSFSTPTSTVAEGAGTIEVKLVLDKPASTDIIIDYDLSGTAIEAGDAATQSEADYEIDGDVGQVEIEKGETEGIIEIIIHADAAFEPDETIEISIDDVDSDNIEVTTDNETEVTITNDDQQATVSFVNTTATVTEADGLLEIQVTLDNPAGENVTIEYALSGTAIDSLTGWENEEASDYYIDGVSGELGIASGETTGTIRLQLYTDLAVEDANTSTAVLDPETIIISITEASGGVIIGANDEMTITLKQQDGRVVLLEWDESYTTVDMDLFVWIGENVSSLSYFTRSASPGFDPPEGIFIPDNLPQLIFDSPDAAFGFSYNYYEGVEDPMNFTVTFIDVVNSVVEGAATRDIYETSYTLANVNPWDTSGDDPIVVQTMEKAGGQFINVTSITIPGAGSRVRNREFPQGMRKGGEGLYKHFKTQRYISK
jgi:hypothetical protein